MKNDKRNIRRRKILADNIGRLRYQAGYSQQQFANMLGICKSNLQRYEWNMTEPRFTVVCRMAELLEVDIRQLILPEKEWKAIEEKTHEH
jgi:transcriptional regulator with XRE-family HTH domain